MTEFTNQPAIVELMGHAVIAGHVSEEEHVGTKMLRVDVPEVNGRSAFIPTQDRRDCAKFFGGSAVYAITPTNEASMLEAAQQMQVRPVQLYVLPERQLAAPDSRRSPAAQSGADLHRGTVRGPEWDDPYDRYENDRMDPEANEP